jgi:hypothetical protein
MEEQLFKLKNNLFYFNHTRNHHTLKYNLLIQSTIKAVQEAIHKYKILISIEKNRILNQSKLYSSSTFFDIINTIELRENNMHERAHYFIQY